MGRKGRTEKKEEEGQEEEEEEEEDEGEEEDDDDADELGVRASLEGAAGGLADGCCCSVAILTSS